MLERLSKPKQDDYSYDDFNISKYPEYFDFWGNFDGWMVHLITMGWYLTIFSLPSAFVF